MYCDTAASSPVTLRMLTRSHRVRSKEAAISGTGRHLSGRVWTGRAPARAGPGRRGAALPGLVRPGTGRRLRAAACRSRRRPGRRRGGSPLPTVVATPPPPDLACPIHLPEGDRTAFAVAHATHVLRAALRHGGACYGKTYGAARIQLPAARGAARCLDVSGPPRAMGECRGPVAVPTSARRGGARTGAPAGRR